MEFLWSFCRCSSSFNASAPLLERSAGLARAGPGWPELARAGQNEDAHGCARSRWPPHRRQDPEPPPVPRLATLATPYQRPGRVESKQAPCSHM